MPKVAKILNEILSNNTDKIDIIRMIVKALYRKREDMISIRSWYNTYEEMAYGKERRNN